MKLVDEFLADPVGKIKSVASLRFVMKYWWVWCLILITVFAFWSRSIPAQYGELQALDPFFAYRLDEYMLEHNLQLPEYDYMRYWPTGVHISSYGPLMYLYFPVYLYVAFAFLGINMTFLQFAILYPAMMGAVSVFTIFWIGKEIFDDKKAGLFAALFLATIPAYIARTSAGFFDKEATGGTFLLITIYFFIKAYKSNSWKHGLMAAPFAFLAAGSWGGSGFFLYLIFAFLLIKLLINQYRESMIKAAFPSLITIILTQRFFLGEAALSFEQTISIIIMSLIMVRYSVERYRLVREDQLPYLVPGLIIALFITVLVGSMFSDFLWGLLATAQGFIQLGEKGVIASTVAEQMTGTWGDVVSRANIGFSGALIPMSSPFDTLFSVWFLMLLAPIFIVYNIYTKKNWVLLFPLIWLIMSIQTVFFMVRLVFFFAPPACIMAGYFLSASINWFKKTGYMQGKAGIHRINVLSLPLAVFLSFLILSNLATGYVFCSSVGPSFNQYWAEAMDYLSEETPVNSSVLSWWDFGYWFQTRGNRPSTADGGNINGTVNRQIAEWYMTDAQNWSDHRQWLQSMDVKYILQDYTLPGKYGAISKIGSDGKQIIGMLQFSQTGAYPQDNKTIVEFKAGQYTIWLPVSPSGTYAGPPMFMVSQGEQYAGRTYITDICTPESGIVRFEVPEGASTMPGCITITAYGLFYVPPEAEFSIFTNLMFMDGYGIPDVKKVFDNRLIKIYKLEINETAGV